MALVARSAGKSSPSPSPSTTTSTSTSTFVCRSTERREPAGAGSKSERTGAEGSVARGKPVAMMVTFTTSRMFSLITAPKMMLASSPALSWIIEAASLTSRSAGRGRP
jgi:hypothetical protein